MDEREVLRRVKRAREKHLESEAARAAIEVRRAADVIEEADLPTPRRDLFPPFWCEGELAVLTGPPGVGKSLLAVQLAQALAAGTPPLLRDSPPYEGGVASRAGARDDGVVLSSPLATLYIDLERSDRQIAELYTAEDGEAYQFSENLEWGLLADVEMPESYGGRQERFYLDALSHRLVESSAPVVIIDNLSWLTRSGGAAELHSVMRSFRRWVNETGRSMLVLRHSREDLAMHGQPAAFEMADSIFALCRSTMGDNIRYLKALRTSFAVNEVMVLRNLSEPYRGFEFSGVSPEELHLFDYAAHVKRVNRRLEQVTQLHAPPLKLVPTNKVNFLAITDGKKGN